MFSRSKTDPGAGSSEPGVASSTGQVGGKGRPTPSRKEAEAANRAKAKPPRGRKEMLAAQRVARGSSSQKVRAGIKAGDERYLLSRDKGPVRRFVRDFIDSRFSFVELMLPLLALTLVLGWSGNRQLQAIGNAVLLAMLLAVLVDLLIMRHRLGVQLGTRFPDASRKGLTYYAITRSLQMKFMRVPKPQVKIGQKLPERYR